MYPRREDAFGCVKDASCTSFHVERCAEDMITSLRSCAKDLEIGREDAFSRHARPCYLLLAFILMLLAACVLRRFLTPSRVGVHDCTAYPPPYHLHHPRSLHLPRSHFSGFDMYKMQNMYKMDNMDNIPPRFDPKVADAIGRCPYPT